MARLVERFAVNGSAVYVDGFLVERYRVSVVFPEVISRRVLAREAAEQALRVEAGYQNEAQQAEVELNLAAGPVLQGIYGSDLRRIRVARVEFVEVFVASASLMFCSNRFCLLCLSFSTATETKLRQQSGARKVRYRG